MYCPICGLEVNRLDWRCEGCGTDLRRVIREEYWDKLEVEQQDETIGDRFKLPDRPPVSIDGWRSRPRPWRGYRRLPSVYIGVGAAGLAVLILVVFFLFRSSPQPEGVVAVESQSAIDEGNHTPSVDEPGSPSPSASTSPAPAAAGPAMGPPSPVSEDMVRRTIEEWKTAWEKSAETKKVDALGKFYADDFRYEPSGKRKDSFLKSREKEAADSSVIRIEISDIRIATVGGRTVSTFQQNYVSDRYSDAGIKKLTWVKRGSRALIVAESFEDGTPAAKMSIAQVKERVMGWRKAWEELAIKHELGDLPSYYDPNFKSPSGRSRDSYLARKLEVAKKSTIIAVDIKNMRVSVLGDRAIASFEQSFRSENYSDEGVKILVFKLVGGKPVITMEGFHIKAKLPNLEMNDFWGD